MKYNLDDFLIKSQEADFIALIVEVQNRPDYTIKNLVERIESIDDIFKPVLGKRIDTCHRLSLRHLIRAKSINKGIRIFFGRTPERNQIYTRCTSR